MLPFLTSLENSNASWSENGENAVNAAEIFCFKSVESTPLIKDIISFFASFVVDCDEV